MLVAVANAQCYGAGMRIAPRADITDGLLDIVVVEHLSRLAFLRSFPQVFRGTHEHHPAVHMWQAREARVETQTRQHVLVDGELQAETPLDVRVAPRRARLWMPGSLGPVQQPLLDRPTPSRVVPQE